MIRTHAEVSANIDVQNTAAQSLRQATLDTFGDNFAALLRFDLTEVKGSSDAF